MYRIVALLAISTALVAGCGDDEEDGGGGGGGGAQASASVEEYCELYKSLDAAGSAFFAPLEAANAPAAEFKKAEKAFAQAYEEEFKAFEAAAPEELAEDVKLLLAGARARAGLGPKVSAKKQQAAEKRVDAYQRKNC